MLGLADALQALHHQNFRHGDLKPANILHFNIDGEGVLMITDFGLSRGYTKKTDRRHAQTRTRASTASYEAPEVYEHPSMPRSRKYDIWSIGCIFLEFTIWLLYDFKALDCFNRASNGSDYSFYKPTPGGLVEIHPAVSAAIDALREDLRCKGGTALGDLVNLIANGLLLIDVGRRYSGAELREKLQKIFQEAEKNPSYLLNIVDPSPPFPLIFQHVGYTVTDSGYYSGPRDKQSGVNEVIQREIKSRIEALPADSESSSSPTDYRHGSSRSPSDKHASSVTSSYGDSRHLTGSPPASKNDLLPAPPTTSARAALPVQSLDTVNEDPDTAQEQHPSDLFAERETIGGGVDMSDANFEDYASKADTVASKLGSYSEMFSWWLWPFIEKTLEQNPLSDVQEALSPRILREFAIRLGHEGRTEDHRAMMWFAHTPEAYRLASF